MRATCPKRSTRRASISIAGRSRASRCSAIAGSEACELLDNLIGEGVGEVYVAKYFPPDYKAKMDELVANLVAAMSQRLKTLAWMDDATRAEAEKKLATFDPRIGYPVKWRDYSAYTVEQGKLFENARNGTKFEWNRQVARLDEPVDRDEWGMNPQTVNAYYNPLVNQITFPAAILQPPFFDPYADAAVNYGAIGAVIGHEIGHGYDDQGRQYDETGKIRNWWTPETNERFTASIARFADQYNAFCPHRRRLRERQLHDGREHRRPRRPRDGVHGVQAFAWA